MYGITNPVPTYYLSHVEEEGRHLRRAYLGQTHTSEQQPGLGDVWPVKGGFHQV